MTIQDKIAALPRLLAEDEYFGVGGILLDEETVHQIDALQARLDLALEVLRAIASDDDGNICGICNYTFISERSINDARALLAACEGESRE
jgi:hypothetical protein